ncbi:MAG TPA: hypothetical protein VJ873_03600 [bacterium]|nr:hypothetical protein [bacterium]
MQPMTRKISLLAAIVFLFSVSLVSAQNADTGLTGSLETNHQSYFYKDPNKAFLLAFFPGLLIHGYGHFYADDNIMGNVLLTGEVVSVLSVGAGALIKSDTNTFSGGLLGNPQDANNIGTNLIWGGIIAFTGLWIVDMAHAPTAATDFDNEHGLKPVAYFEQNGPILALAYRF